MTDSHVEHGLLEGFLPHGTCIAWDVPLLTIYVLSDLLTAIAYLAIPFGLFYLYSQNKDAFKPIYLLFAVTFLACGLGHLTDIITIWFPLYYLEASIKVVTAISSISAISYVIYKRSIVSKCVGLVGFPDFEDLLQLIEKLKFEINQRADTEQQLRRTRQDRKSVV